jgi:hypothetical protein
MQLGRLIKENGYRQDVILGKDKIHISWYGSVKEVFEGFRKNAFSGVDYSMGKFVLSMFLMLLVYEGPFIGSLFLTGTARWLCVLASCLLAVSYMDSARYHGLRCWHVIGFPVGILVLVTVFLQASVRTIRQGGIYWRGTYYPLHKLKAQPQKDS